ncbi:MAG: circularly permuted type 2 ATP-grasp protein [Acetobacteraceae bacterium]|nr:circularly permuted type 2 ATP-grasp protein [Acetobacteraceae bacterium]
MRDAGPLDEMVDGAGQFRQHWRRILDPVFGLGSDELAERSRLLQQAFADEGFASVLPGARSVHWHCDPIPLPIAGGEFAALERGLIQRAELLELILRDVYGRQTLLAEGALPPALVYPNPNFQRPCRATVGPRAHDGPLMQAYAADLVRGPDGRWQVIGDLTEAPGGAAYALENRRMLSRIFPEVFRNQEIWQLSNFFEAWQDALQRAAGPVSNPGVALLTVGHADPAWFEHVLLARELSCALVEGRDLTVRGGQVYIKTLRGLQPVDVLLRRQEGAGIDPLEMESRGPVFGVPGLLDAARGGSIHIYNDPGSGWAESPALSAFLPDLAFRLLDEPLLLPSVLTLWLGQEGAREMVGGSLGHWLIRPALDGSSAPLDAAALSPAGNEKLAAEIAAHPWMFAASASVAPSVAPSVGESAIEPRRIVLRMFLVHDGKGWQVMRGGLARALAPEESLSGRLPRQAMSKDVWVLVDDTAAIVGPGQVFLPPLAIRRTPADMPARIAADFFWLGRYLERLESASRLIRMTITRLGRAAPMPRERAELHVLLACLVRAGLVHEERVGSASSAALADAMLRTTAEDGAIFRLLNNVGRLSEQLRDRMTNELYATVTTSLRGVFDGFRAAQVAEPSRGLEGLSQALGDVLRLAATIAGLSAENMVRVGGRLFLDLGRRLERAEAIPAELAAALAPQGAATQPGHIETGLRLALELRDSSITYRSRYCTVVQPAPALDLVLADDDNPRALAYQLAALRDLLTEVAGASTATTRSVSELLEEAQAMVTDVAQAEDQALAAAQLPPRLSAIRAKITGIGERIARQYFELLPVAHAVGLEPDRVGVRGAA